MTNFDPNMRYVFYAEEFEENIIAWRPDDLELWIDAIDTTLSNMSVDDALKVLSELRLSTERKGAKKRLAKHYGTEEMRLEVLESWTRFGHYPPED